jgi:N-acetylmuramoyl-L-alanine amidase
MALSQAQKDFIAKVGALAAADMKASGVLASLTVAQAILESGWGTSALATDANALFGIKADSRWSGRVYSTATKECYDGVNFTTVDALFRAYGSWEQSLADHSAFLIAGSRYKAVIGEKDYKTACAAIHAAGYATDPDYAGKLVNLIETYGLAAFDAASGKEDATLNLRTLLFTNNACYKAGRTITPKGIMVHSTGANNPNLKRYVGPDDGLLGKNQNNNHWNQDKPDGRQVCVHAFIGKLADGSVATYQTLPWNHRGWHGGSGSQGSVNDTHIGFEICEDGLTDAAYFNAVHQEAVELCAYLCQMYNFDPMKDGVIIGHYEGYKRGIASNHGDPANWFPKHGKSMDTFRAAVKAALAGSSGNEAPAPEPAEPPKPDVPSISFKVGDIVQFTSGAVYISSTAPTLAHSRGKSLCKVTKVVNAKHPYHLVSEDNGGVHGWVDTADVSAINAPTPETPAFQPYTVKVTADELNIRKGPGVSYGTSGSIRDKGVYTIVEEASGAGASKWGRLKSGVGWISLDYAQKR